MCKACRETAGVPTINVSHKRCKCGRCRPVHGPVGSRPKDAVSCKACRAESSEPTENVVRKRTLETQRRKNALRTAADGNETEAGASEKGKDRESDAEKDKDAQSPPTAVVPDGGRGGPGGDRVLMTTMSGSPITFGPE